MDSLNVGSTKARSTSSHFVGIKPLKFTFSDHTRVRPCVVCVSETGKQVQIRVRLVH